jgi:hypothetical protein
MIKALTGKYRKHTAWFLFFVFYGQLAVSLRAGQQETVPFYTPYKVYTRGNAARPSFTSNSTTPSPFNITKPDEPVRVEALLKNNMPVAIDGIDKVDIGGPGQPEMTTFKSIGADNMVNLFTGDFSYSIPLLDVGGYPVNLFYNAGVSMEQEASWVGLGWNINPGTISRNMRGLPDDYNGEDKITKEQSIKADRTIGVSLAKNLETFGISQQSAFNIGINLGASYNNRRGLGLEAGGTGEFAIYKQLSFHSNTGDFCETENAERFTISGGLNINSQYGMTRNLGFAVYKFKTEKFQRQGLSTSINYSSRQGLTDIQIGGEYKWYKFVASSTVPPTVQTGSYSAQLSNITFGRSSFTPTIRMPMTRLNQFYSVKLGKEKIGMFNNASISGYIQESRLDPVDRIQTRRAYGYMYYEEATNDKEALMDFNRINDGVFTVHKPLLPLPVYTHDVFTINGEGTGGSFRGYRGNIGYVRDHETATKSTSVSASLDLGAGQTFHGGTAVGHVYSPSFVEQWDGVNNPLSSTAVFQKSDGIKQGFYFKNPGEKAIIDQEFYEKVGDDKLIRPHLGSTNTATPYLKSSFQVLNDDKQVTGEVPVTAEENYRDRDKRTQVITYLTAEEADLVGLDKLIYSYTENEFSPGNCADNPVKTGIRRYDPYNPDFYRKKHHLSEIDVLESDGRRYVYGIPVYQIKQEEVTFSIEGTPTTKQLIDYTPGEDNSQKNNWGRDQFFEKETMNGYAHSFLLTAILSPDYVDVTDNGISDDDLGTAIRFNYSRPYRQTYNGNYWEAFKWRIPADANKANYNEGLRADSKDDKAMYTYGEKELWYLHSIESKNMVATFHTSSRDDGWQVGENGGNTGSARQRKLDKINLYTKADFLRDGENARPIKTVHFQYDNSLCVNYPLNSTPGGGGGKLTLTAIWCTYTNNPGQVENRYYFKYKESPGATGDDNPAFNPVETDRWGVYKPHASNPDGMDNHYYPYTLQNSAQSNVYAAAWNLQKVLLPGGALLKVEYEADDYGYVQNKRASQMTSITGFGHDPDDVPTNSLYTYMSQHLADVPKMDNRIVFFTAPAAITGGRTEIKEKYLKDINQLLLKLWVKMPRGNVGAQAEYEPVVVYAAIEDYDMVPDDPTDTKFYIKVEETKRGGSPIMETVMQFLKDQLPHRAYPGYEVSGDGALLQVVRAVMGMVNSFTEGVLGFEKNLKLKGACKEVALSKSFARLNNPARKKIGGGHRVKKVTISDNWSRMKGQFDSEYGQVYSYTTTEVINGVKTEISSGVATYEPGIGNEENPFREVLKFSEKQPLGPTDFNNVELPFGETFFPAPMVGYSKVTVKSIHNKDNKKIKSGVGMQQTEFYTSRDFPVICDYTTFDDHSRRHPKPGIIETVFNFDKKDYLTITQGFRIVLNDMNGKTKSQASFPENDYSNPISATTYHYRVQPWGDKFRLDNTIPVISGSDGVVTNKLIGKDVEVMNDFRQLFSYTQSIQVPLNVDVFSLGGFPLIIPTIFRASFRNESMFRSAVTVKVVNEYGILEKVVNTDKGSVISTQNLVYDAETGDPLVSRTDNPFKKPVYTFNYPAWWVHSGMEPAYRNIDLTYKNVFFRNGRIEESSHVNMAHFESGDEIYVSDMDEKGPIESLACIAALYPVQLPRSDAYRIWAVDIRKDDRNDPDVKEMIFIDRDGNPFNAVNATIRVIRSGKRNLGTASVGSIVSLANPVRTVGNQQVLTIDNNTDVLSAAAAEFKEKWRANDMFYTQNTITRTVKQAAIATTYINSDNTHAFGEYFTRNKRYFDNIANPGCFAAEQYDNTDGNKDFNHKSWIRFNVTGLTSSDIVLQANLRMWSHRVADHEFYIHENEKVPFCPDRPAFYRPDEHSYNYPHISKPDHVNDFLLTRMLTSTWPGDEDCNGWQRQYNFYPPTSGYTQWVKGTPPAASIQDYTIPVTNLVRDMLRDKFDLAKNYVPGLRIELAQVGNKPSARVCFWDHNAGSSKPQIEVIHYNCETAEHVYTGPIENAPTEPDEGYILCISDAPTTVCLSVFDKERMNPYIEGVIGNWRAYRSYVYYGERRESDFSQPTDIRKDGVIKDYESYWTLAAEPDEKMTKSSSTKWVWNTEITQYNRKGAELENHDTLGRYNAGIYGYQESLPVAVINNSRLRLSAFDGFEDYFYKDEPCDFYCPPSKRHFPTGISTNSLDSTISHTGKYSLKIAANSNIQMNVPISADNETYTPDIKIELNKTLENAIVGVTPNGRGLKASYYNSTNFTDLAATVPWEDVNFVIRARDNNSCRNDSDPLPDGVQCGNMSVRWEGSVQVETQGDYSFASSWTNDECSIWVKGPGVSDPEILAYNGHLNNGQYIEAITPITMAAGLLYHIRIEFKQFGGVGEINLIWKKPGATSFVNMDNKHLYPLGMENLANGTTDTDPRDCVKPGIIQAIDHNLIDGFNLVPGKRMVASVWMKKGGTDCHCTNYTNNFRIRDASDNDIASFTAKERIIEGWQQFEAEFIVPENTASLKLYFPAAADAPVYIDDLRIHPFNAHMKSFVYNPVTLRLAAELDENNYAAFYEYDDSGNLNRTKKETRLGIKTITETRSGIQKNITTF